MSGNEHRPTGPDISRIRWYVEHRIEFLRHRQQKLRESLESSDGDPNYDTITEFMENKGRLKELHELSERLERWDG